jgi:CheY-like chemotaxis protein
MSTRYRVALQGFGLFENRALEDYFRQMQDHAPAFVLAESLGEADLCVANGDRADVVDEVRKAGCLDRTVFIGSEPPAGAVVHLGRPIIPKQVVRALETLLLAPNGVAHAYAPTTMPGLLTVGAPSTTSPGRLGRAEPPVLDIEFDSTSSPVALESPSPEEPAPKRSRRVATPVVHFPFDVLVLEGRPTAISPLIAQLDRVGCRVNVARDGDEAAQLIASSPVRIVFCDTQTREVDGMALCQQIKSVKKGAPSVVLMSPKISATDKVRAQLAGADALLAKPIPADDLLEVLRTASNRRRRAR